jgi:hypothetical protein
MAISYSTVDGTGWDALSQASNTTALAGLTATAMDVSGNYVLGVIGTRNSALDTETVTIEDIASEAAIIDATDGTRSTGIAGGFQDGTPSDGAITIDYTNRVSLATAKCGLIFAASGVDTTTPVAASASNSGTGTTVTFPDTASVTSGDLILRICTWEGTGASLPSINAYTGVVGSALPSSGTGVGISFGAVSSSGGAPGTATATLSVSTEWIAFTVVLKAASSTSVAPLAAAYYYYR